MSDLRGRVAIVTGASKGIGAGIAKGLAAAGAAVVVNYASDPDGGNRVVSTITENGGRAIAVQANIAQSGDVARLFQEANAAFGTVDILVNNAGVYAYGPLESITEDEFHRQFNINVLGSVLTMQEFVRQESLTSGSIINISTVEISTHPAETALYTATKAALTSMTRVLARELGPRKIRVNAIVPGATETEGGHAMDFYGTDAEKQFIALTPLGRIGQPEDIAPVAVFLASEDSRWITGDVIFASGGLQ